MLIFVYLASRTKISTSWRFFKVTLKALENNVLLRETNEILCQIQSSQNVDIVTSFQFLGDLSRMLQKPWEFDSKVVCSRND